MRAIAQEAGVAVGNAYYYFRSKEHLIQGFYARTQTEHLEVSEKILAREKTLKARLMGVMKTKLETIQPYHRFAAVLFKTAADPHSPLSPFSSQSEVVRLAATDLFREVVQGAKARVPADLKQELPDLLWLYHMGIVLFWIHDDSEGARRTHRLMERTVDIVARLIGLASLPLMRPVRRATLRLLAELREPEAV